MGIHGTRLVLVAALAVFGVSTQAQTQVQAQFQHQSQNQSQNLSESLSHGQAQVLSHQARQRIQGFAADLQKALKAGITEQGLVGAIDRCNRQAPAIADNHSQSLWQLRRTALKWRNPSNAPDDWEQEVLRKFEARRMAGESMGSLEAWTIEAGEFRYMKAIPTAEVCLGCHGQALGEPVRRALEQRYPNDRATGFRLGDIRGAFSLRRSLNDIVTTGASEMP